MNKAKVAIVVLAVAIRALIMVMGYYVIRVVIVSAILALIRR